jgi:hypothetical protein
MPLIDASVIAPIDASVFASVFAPVFAPVLPLLLPLFCPASIDWHVFFNNTRGNSIHTEAMR